MAVLCLMEDINKTFRIGEDDVDVLKGVNMAVDEG